MLTFGVQWFCTNLRLLFQSTEHEDKNEGTSLDGGNKTSKKLLASESPVASSKTGVRVVRSPRSSIQPSRCLVSGLPTLTPSKKKDSLSYQNYGICIEY